VPGRPAGTASLTSTESALMKSSSDRISPARSNDAPDGATTTTGALGRVTKYSPCAHSSRLVVVPTICGPSNSLAAPKAAEARLGPPPRNWIHELRASRVQPLINGTGIVVHTNLGRSPLPQGAGDILRGVASAYNNIELDVETGGRGSRGVYIERALAVLCQAEAATLVNNCAAALVLIANHFTRSKKEIVISRGELVQIGGGFRIGEILEASGAKLREVGATNKTTLADYQRAISRETALILKVHRSNFFMSGFVASPTNAEIAALARKKRIPFVEDLGSGATIATETIGSHHEPTAPESLKAGADLVCFSGDKLFGGPQAGIIAGRRKIVDELKRQPLFRALRCDKLTFAALQTTVDLHLNGVISEIPALALLQIPKDELRARAAAGRSHSAWHEFADQGGSSG